MILNAWRGASECLRPPEIRVHSRDRVDGRQLAIPISA